jgi:hypothetical protein
VDARRYMVGRMAKVIHLVESLNHVILSEVY